MTRKVIKTSSEDIEIVVEDGDPPVIWVENIDKFNAALGQILLMPDEIKPLIEGLAEAAGLAAEWYTEDGNDGK